MVPSPLEKPYHLVEVYIVSERRAYSVIHDDDDDDDEYFMLF
jgi:hypothetical protein